MKPCHICHVLLLLFGQDLLPDPLPWVAPIEQIRALCERAPVISRCLIVLSCRKGMPLHRTAKYPKKRNEAPCCTYKLVVRSRLSTSPRTVGRCSQAGTFLGPRPMISLAVQFQPLPTASFASTCSRPSITRNEHPALTLVQDVVEVFIDDPLPALYEKNPADTTGLDVLYSGARIDTTVGSFTWTDHPQHLCNGPVWFSCVLLRCSLCPSTEIALTMIYGC